MREYTVVLEKGSRNWSAYVPDLPGCVAGGSTRRETVALIRQAIKLHVQSMKQDGEPIPRSKTRALLVQV